MFGLIHGFGFASVLKEFGLPQAALGWSLFAFNLGVEVGQLAIVSVVASTLALVRRQQRPAGRAGGAGRVDWRYPCGAVLVRRTGVSDWGRVMKRGLVVGLIFGAGIAVTQAWQPAPPPNVAQIEKVKDNLYMITGAGGGGNTAAFITANGVVLVDTKNPNWGQAILDQVKTVTNKPVTHIINTHTHGDHVGSNEFFPAAVEIVAHENTGANMAKMTNFADAAKKFALPDKTFKDKMTVLGGADAIDLYYFGRGHTNGDIFVVFRGLRTMHAGDIFAQEGHAPARHEQRRQRRADRRDARQGGGRDQERRHRDSPATAPS